MRVYLLAVPLIGLLLGCAAPDPDRPPRVIEPRIDERAAARGASLLERAMLVGHNSARAEAGVPPLAWSEELAADAAHYAAILAETREYKHSTGLRGRFPEGENLFMGSRGAYRYGEMVQLWVDERRMYAPGPVPDISTTGRWQDVAHYTQIIWRRTTQVGCAMASSRSDDYLVCRYSPPGNVWSKRAED